MKTKLLLLLCPFALLAQPTITPGSLTADYLTHTTVRITWASTNPSDRSIAYDEVAYLDDVGTPDGTAFRYSSGAFTSVRTSANGYHSWRLSALKPATAYRACITTWAVTSGPRNVCTKNGGQPTVDFTTAAEPANPYMDPVLPSVGDVQVTPPNTAGYTSRVVDVLCTNLLSHYDAARASSTGSVITIPAGTICRGNYILNATDGTQWIVIRTDTPDAQLPPPGTRATPVWAPKLARIEVPITNMGLLNTSALNIQANVKKLYLIGIDLGYEPYTDATQVDPPSYGGQTIRISDRTGVEDITLDRCLIRGGGFPTRVNGGLFLNGTRLAVVNSYLDELHYWRAYQYGIDITKTSSTVITLTAAATNQVAFGATSTMGFPSGSITITGGTGSGGFRLYARQDGTYLFQHNVADLVVSTVNVEVSYIGSGATLTWLNHFELGNRERYGRTTANDTECTITAGTFSGAFNDASNSGSLFADSEGISEGATGILVGGVTTAGGDKIVVSNNTFHNVIGISVFVQEGFPDSYTSEGNNFLMDRNDFITDVPIPGPSAHHSFLRRQHAETKIAQSVAWLGNWFTGGWGGSVNSSPAVALANRTNSELVTSPALVMGYSGNFTLANNLIENEAMCFELTMGDDGGSITGNTTFNVLLRNNWCEANHWTRWFHPTLLLTSTQRGTAVMNGYGFENLRIEDNTFRDVRGNSPRLLRMYDGAGSYLSIMRNVFSFHTDDVNVGIVGGASSVVGAVPSLTATDGTAALDANAYQLNVGPKWRAADNVFIPGWTSSRFSTGVVDSATHSARYTGVASWVSGADWDARVAAIKWRSDKHTMYDSPIGQNGTYKTTDGRRIGADMAEINAARRVVIPPYVRTDQSGAAIVHYSALGMAGLSCTVEYGISAELGTGTRVDDNAQGEHRSVTLSELTLTPGTAYHVRLYCPTRDVEPVQFVAQ